MLFRRKKKEAAAAEPPVQPVRGAEIEIVRARCREMVRKRALVSAGVAAVPLPGVDILSDLTTFTVLVEEVNREFGLSQQQIERLHPRMRILAYQAAASVGGMLVGKLVTKTLVLQLFKRAGIRIAAKTVTKVVPIAGQVASAAIGFALFRKMGNQHVEACAEVARELQKIQVTDAGTAQVPV
ncbi:hypothetical protein [Massilia sp. MS-15]|uniref:hypothetical protein n=1 Tax=Massilia sp. MS-15 TaxID=2878200 RepID=UPI001CD4D806|nr:hypothetical protein [Massilia sp. MS-15]MCA1245453.1 hypothetical protein [Massilia sp. MS-15]